MGSAPLLAALTLLTGASPARAQTQTVTDLVSNTGQTTGGAFAVPGLHERAQQFTTGSNPEGYNLSAVDLMFSVIPANVSNAEVSLHSDNGSNRPGSLLHSLENPTAITANSRSSFAAPAMTVLTADTSYWVAVKRKAGKEFLLINTRSSAEDSSSQNDWSIRDKSLHRTNHLSSWREFDAFKFAVKGTVVPADTTPPRLTAVVRQTPARFSVNGNDLFPARKLTWRLTFSERVAAGDKAYFGVPFLAGLVIESVTAVGDVLDGRAAVWDVTAAGNDFLERTPRHYNAVDLSIQRDKIKDLSGNATMLPADTSDFEYRYEIDNTDPQIDIFADNNRDEAIPDRVTGPFRVNIRFTELRVPAHLNARARTLDHVMGFDAADITVVNGTVSDLRSSSGSRVDDRFRGWYSALITPTAPGAVSIDIAADVAKDEAGNDNEAATRATTMFVNAAPAITTTSPLPVAENTTAVATLAATDADGHSLAWSTNGGTDEGRFELTTAGALSFASAPDFESPADAGGDNGYAVTVRVTDGWATVEKVLTVNVTDASEQPATPGAPTVTATANSSLDVSWTAPDLNGGPALTGYDVQYRQSGTTGAFASHAHSGTDTATTLTGLTADTSYDVRVRAKNGETPSAWSASGTGSTSPNTAPTVTSIERQTPTTSPTKEDTLKWRVTFNENVENVGTADFKVDGTTATVTDVTEVTAKTVYDVTVSGGNLADLNGTVTLSFASGQDIADSAGKALTATTPTGTNNNTYVVDNTAPTVTSIERQTPTTSPTKEDTLKWRVTFNENVENVGTADFKVDGTTATVTDVTEVTAKTVYDVTVSGGDLADRNGTVTLSFVSGQDIANSAGNALTATTPTGTNDNTYVVDNTAPRITSIVRHDPTSSPTNADTVTWRVTFSEDVKNVDKADFEVLGFGGNEWTLTKMTASTYDLAVMGTRLASWNGTVRMIVSVGGHQIKDMADNALTNSTPTGTSNKTYVVDNTAPTVTSIVRQTPTSSPTKEDTLKWRVTFSENVKNVGTADFRVGGTTATVTDVTEVTASTVYDVTASGGDLAGLNGTVTLSFASGQDIADIADNDLTATTPTGTNNNTYVVDNTAPTVTSIERQDPTTLLTKADTLKWRVTFNENVENVGTADFKVAGTTATVTDVTEVTASTVYDVTVSGGDLADLDGAVTLSFASGQDIADIAGNTLTATAPTGTNDNTYEVGNSTIGEPIDHDITAPTVTSIVRQAPTSSPTKEDTLKWRVTFNENVKNVGTADFQVTGTTATVTAVTEVTASTVYDVTASGGDLAGLNGTVTLSFASDQDIADIADNDLTATTPTGTNNNTYVVDNTAPTVTSIVRQDPTTSPTKEDTLKWRVTFSENVENVGTADFQVAGTTATVTVAEVTASTVYDVTASGGDLAGLNGTVTLSFAGDQDIADSAGNALTATTPTGTNDNTYVVDNTAPTVTISGVPTTSTARFTATFTFSEAVTGFVVGDITVGNGTAGTFMETTTGTVFTALITPTATGTVTVDVAAGVATDAVSTPNTAATRASSTYTAPTTNAAPTVANEIPDQEVVSGTTFSYEFPANTFNDADGDTLTYTAVEDGETGLPSWLTLTGRTFSGTPADSDAEMLTVKVTASDGNSGSVSDSFIIHVGRTCSAPSYAAGEQELWKGTVDVGTHTDGHGFRNNGIFSFGSLDNSEVQLDGTRTATIVTIAKASGQAILGFAGTDSPFTTAELPRVNLYVCGTPLALRSATSSTGNTYAGDNTSIYQWRTRDSTLELSYYTNADVRLAMTAADTTAPTVTSIVRQDPTTSPTKEDTLKWRVTFSENVSNVSPPDFQVAGTTATVTAVSTVTAFTVYDVTASGGNLADRNGTVTLSFASGQDIVDNVNNALTATTPTGTNDNTYVVDNTAPTVTSIDRQDPTTSPTNADTLKWRVTFSENVKNVGTADFEVAGTTATVTAVTQVTASTVYDVTASGGNLASRNGTVTLSFASSQDIADIAGIALTATTPTGTNNNTYVVDNTAPTVTSIVRQDPTTSPTKEDTLKWRVTFSADMKNVDTTDFQVDGTTATVTVAEVTASTVYDVTASGGDLAGLNGTVTLSFASDQDIADSADNALTATTPTGTNDNTYVVNNTAPTVTSIVRQDPTTSPTKEDTLKWRVTFSENVKNVGTADFQVAGTTATVTVAEVTASTVYDVTASGGNLASRNGTVTLSFASDQDIVDNVNNALTATTPTGTNDDTYVVDNTAPTVTSIVRQTPTSSPTNADTLKWRVTFSENVKNVGTADFQVAGTTATVTVAEVTASTVYDVTASGGDLAGLNGTVTLSFASDQDIADIADNALTATTPTGTNNNTYVVDNTAPTVTSIVRQDPTTSPTKEDTLKWRVTFSEDVKNVGTADFQVAGTTATVTVAQVTASTVYDVTASGGNLASRNGTVTLSFANSQDIVDSADNALTATTPTGTNDNTYVVDNTAPTVTISGVPTTSTARFTATFTFSEAVTGFVVGDITVGNGTAGTFMETTTGTVFTALITPTATGTVTVDVAAGVATDAVSTPNTAATRASSTYTAPRANAAPTVANEIPDQEVVSGTTFSYEFPANTFNDTDGDTLTYTAVEDGETGLPSWLTLTGRTFSGTPADSDAEMLTVKVTASDGNSGSVSDSFIIHVGRTCSAPSYAAGEQELWKGTVDVGTHTDGHGFRNNGIFSFGSLDNSEVQLDGTRTATIVTIAKSSGQAILGFAGTDSPFTTAELPRVNLYVCGTPLALRSATSSTGNTYAGDNTSIYQWRTRDSTLELSHYTNADIRLAMTAADTTAPTVTSIVRQDPTTSPTKEDTLKWRVTFSENVSNVSPPDFQVAGTTATVTAVSTVTAFTVYDVTASGGNLADRNGTVTLSFASGQDIVDTVNNALTATTPTGTNDNTYVVDNTAPTVTSIDRQDPTTSPTKEDTLTWRVTFNEDVENVGTADFEVAGTTATVTAVSVVTASTVYDVTASGGNLASRNGTVTLSFASSQDIADIAGIALTATTPTGTNNNTYVVDNTAPTVTSIVRQDPTTSPTKEDTLKWRVTFSADMKNVDTADFQVDGTTATVTVAEVTASTVYDVTASGGDLAGLNGTVTLSFASGQDIADSADNALTATTPTGTNDNTYVVNNTAPTVTSIVRQDPTTSPTKEDTLKWRVTFSENVKNVGTADFQVAGTTATVTVVEVTASTVYDVTVSGGNLASRNGTVTLSFASGQDIADIADNALTATTPTGTNDNTYVVDNTAPTVTSIVRQTPTSSPTNADTLKWRVTFNENMKNVGTADFRVAGTTATVTVAEVTASTVYDVTASGGDLAGLNGTVTLSFASGQNITDSADNALTATTPTGTNDNTYVVNNTAPTVTSIVRQDPTTSPTKEDTLKWRVTFSENVKNVGTADFQVAGTTATVTVAEVTASTVYDVTASGGNLASRNGTVTLSFASGQDIADIADNALTATTPTGTNNNTYVVDNTAPTVTSIVRQTPTSSPTKEDTLKWRVTFSENVKNVGTADFQVAGTTATVTVAEVTASTVYDVTVSGGNLASRNGTVTLSFASGQDIADIADNALTATTPTGTNNNTYVVDNTAPTVTISGVPTTSMAPFTATFTFSEAVTGFVVGDITVGNGTAGTFMETTTDTVFTALITPMATGTVTVDVAAGVATDKASNPNTVATRVSSSYTAPIIDTTAPTVASIVRQDPTTSPTKEDTLKWRVTFSENVKNVGTADFQVAGTTATVTAVTQVTASTVYDVTASGGNLASRNGTVTLSFASGQDIADSADNDLTATTPTGTNNNTYVVDNTAPTVASIVRQDPTTSPTKEDTLKWRVTFSENVKNVGTADFQVAGTTATVTVAEVTASTVYDVTASGGNLASRNGTVTLSFTGGQDIADSADNALTATTPTGTNNNTYVVDNTAPTVASIVRQDPTTSPTKEDTLKWRVTFSENVKNVGTADFQVAGTTATVTVAEVTASTVYDVTASGGNLASQNGTVTLSFTGGQDIADSADNALTATTPTGTNDNTYVVNNTAPTVASIVRQDPTTSPTKEDTLKWRVTFSENVKNVGTADFEVSGTTATVTAVTQVTASTVYDVTVSGGNLAGLDGTVTLLFASGQDIADSADNALTATTPTGTNNNTYVVDNTAPTVTISGVPATSTAPFTATFTFSEAVTGFVVGDITVGNGTAGTFMETTTGGVFTALITPTATGTVTVDVGVNKATDTANNPNTAATQASSTYTAPTTDTTAPTVASIVRQDPTTSPTNADTLKWRVTFSENVKNVGTADFEAAGTTATVTVAEVTASTVYDVTASGGNLASLDGMVTLSFASGQDIADSADNALTATTPTGTNNNTYVVDNTAPTVTSIVRQDPTTSPTNTDTLKWRVTFSENVKNVGTADFEAAGTTATVTVAEVTASTVYDVTASGGNLPSLDGMVTLSFASGQDIADSADNALTATTPTGTNNNTYVVDNTAPTVTISGVPATSTAPFTATFTFSEAVTGFVVGDITVGNGTAGTFMETTTGGVFTALITPTATGTVTVDVGVNKATDTANNPNTAATRVSSSYTAPTTDTTAPTVASIVRQDPTTSPTNADTLKWRVTFSENVKNVGTADFEVAGTTATVTAVTQVTASTVYDVTVSGGNLASLDGTVTLSFASGQDIADIADNALTATTPAGTNDNTFVVDNTAPTVAITGAPATFTDPFTATFTFSETVTGFTVGDITVGNGTAGTFMETTTGTVFTALITPTATGTVTADVEAGVATDAAGNPNTAATQATSNYTVSVPVPVPVPITKELTREWTSRFGSTVVEQVLDAVESRMQASRVPGFEVNLAGENIRPRPPLLFGAEAEKETSGSDGSEFVSGGDAARVRTWSRALTQQDLLLGSSFHVASEGGGLGGGTVAVWGAGALSHFDGGDNDLTVDGEVTLGMLGADWSRERTLAGLIVGHSTSDGDYQAPEGDGVVSSTVTGVYPWGRHGLSDRIDVWGTVGYGKGTLELTPDGKGKGTISADLDMWMVASGLRGTLVDGGIDGFTLTGKTEAMMVETSTAAVAGQLAASEARVTRLRLGLEGSMPVAVGDGQVLTPSLELGLRHDGGDGDTGFGADMGAGIAWTDQQSRIDVELRGRGLLTHETNGFRERGISGSLGWDPAPGSDLGPSFSVTQSFGGASSGGADALLQRSTLAGLATNDNGTGADDLTVGRLEARFGYGLPVFGYGWTLTPEVGVSLSDTGRDYSVDWGLVRQVPPGDIGALDISLGVRRRESTTSADTPEHKAALQLNIRW